MKDRTGTREGDTRKKGKVHSTGILLNFDLRKAFSKSGKVKGHTY